MFAKRDETLRYFNAMVQVRGVAPRCRKSDFHIEYTRKSIPLTITDAEIEVLKNEAKAVVAKYKGVKSAELVLKYMWSDTVGIESCCLIGCKDSKQFNLLAG